MAEKYSSADFITKHTVNHDDTSPVTLHAEVDGCGVAECIVEVTETWDDGAKAFKVGDDDTDDDGFVEEMGADLGTAGYYNIEHDEWGAFLWHNAGSHRRLKLYTGAANIIATFVGAGTGGTQGQCVVYIHHMRFK